jgi:hypothetical protein
MSELLRHTCDRDYGKCPLPPVSQCKREDDTGGHGESEIDVHRGPTFVAWLRRRGRRQGERGP